MHQLNRCRQQYTHTDAHTDQQTNNQHIQEPPRTQPIMLIPTHLQSEQGWSPTQRQQKQSSQETWNLKKRQMCVCVCLFWPCTSKQKGSLDQALYLAKQAAKRGGDATQDGTENWSFCSDHTATLQERERERKREILACRYRGGGGGGGGARITWRGAHHKWKIKRGVLTGTKVWWSPSWVHGCQCN